MINLGLRPANDRKLYRLLTSAHRIAIVLTIMDLDFNELNTVSSMFLDGQVSVDGTQPITRSLDLTLQDPRGRLHFDSNSPEDGALFADRMIRVEYAVISPDRQDRFEIPVFTGPITGLERSGVEISVEAQGREVLGMAPVWTKRTWKEKTKKTTVIKQILTQIMGEKAGRVDVPDLAAKLTKDVHLTHDGEPPWVVAVKLASTLGYQLFYDGRGHVRMRRFSRHTTFRFKANEMVKTRPTVGYSIENLVNCVDVLGADPKGKKKRIHVRISADRKHPLSPRKLGTDQAPRRIPAFYEDDSLKTEKEAKSFARRMLRDGLEQSVEVAFDSLPYPLGEPGDMVAVRTSEFSERFRMQKFTLPLSCGGSSSIGYLKNVKPNRKAIRRRKAS